MTKSYEHLSVGDRALIQVMVEDGFSRSAIALRLKRARSTVCRELARNGYLSIRPAGSRGRTPVAKGYHCHAAQDRADALAQLARVAPKLVVGNLLWQRVVALLRDGLSPEQIAHTLKAMPQPICISHESIYSAIYVMPRGELRAQIVALLRQSRKNRRPRSRGEDRRGLIANMTSIHERPIEVDERLVPGHWEGDLIKGSANKSQVGTLAERTTLFTVLVQLDKATATHTALRFAQVFKRINSQMCLSMTYDQGREMSAHEQFTQATGMTVYFADPHSPWQRGINENTNGLLRQDLPKSSDLSVYSQKQLDAIAWRLNTRPRKSLGWKAPAELFLPKGSFDTNAYWAHKLSLVALGS
jgi:IS30 family transposase